VLLRRLSRAFITAQQDNVMHTLYGLAILYLVIKVPGLMSASGHMELRAERLAHHAWKEGAKALAHARTGGAARAAAA